MAEPEPSNLPDRTDTSGPRASELSGAEMRASDADRERVAEILRTAAAEGRLRLDELDERLATVYAAKTYAELVPVTHDLPVTPMAVPAQARGSRIGGRPTSSGGVAIMGGFNRKGPWVVPPLFTGVAFWGGAELDLREARFAEAEVTIRVFAVMGGFEIIVPEDAEVVVNGVGIMGGFDHSATGPGAPGAPRIVVSGLAFWGGASVERRPPQAELDRRKAERRQAREERRRLRRGY